jgi:hypothetical protein
MAYSGALFRYRRKTLERKTFMAETIDEISIDVEDEGQLTTEQLDKIVLTRGAWTTILFRYRTIDPKTGEFGAPKATVKRFQKHNGIFKKRDSINLSAAVAKQLIEALSGWLDEGLLDLNEK